MYFNFVKIINLESELITFYYKNSHCSKQYYIQFIYNFLFKFFKVVILFQKYENKCFIFFFSLKIYKSDTQFNWLEHLPVTVEVASSTLVVSVQFFDYGQSNYGLCNSVVRITVSYAVRHSFESSHSYSLEYMTIL